MGFVPGYKQIGLPRWCKLVKNPPANARDIRDGGSILWVRKIWRRKWQPTPVISPGEPHGQRNLGSYSPWGHKESDMTEVT